MLSSSSVFALYSSPEKSAQYSVTWFQKLTFSGSIKLIYPLIQKPQNIVQWAFSPEIPAGHATTMIDINEPVPHMADLVPISKEMEAAYSAGSRSVAVTFTVDGKRSEQLYQFSKIRLFIHINNYQVAVQSAHNLVHHLSTSSIVSSGFFSAFITLPILSAIRGLRGSTFPLWKLSCLLREEWLHEDILNALAELMYFQMQLGRLNGIPAF
ncbi:hypothetical protein C8J57DRAFT_1059407 [Mycena rebaudengoi]|nr:hypothetical protein C8J57DRAFT_1059407 [Mycena rebaudengoi]